MSPRRRSVLHGLSGAAAAAVVLALCHPPASAEEPPPANALLERLIRVPAQHQVLQASSRNKTGHNGDENWPLYVDEHGDDVIFDAAGPGCVRSMWGTHFAEDSVFKFYFDGEVEPRYELPVHDFYRGRHPHFPPPLVSYEERGQYGDLGWCGNSFVPIPFATSLKISVAGESRFFHLLYELYPHGTPTSTFTGEENRGPVLDSFARLHDDPVGDLQGEVIEVTPEGTEPGQSVTLLDRQGAGVIRKLIIEAEGSEEFFRESSLHMHWDARALDDVHVPTGIFFGVANHAREAASLPLRVESLGDGHVRLSCYFPMPFWHGARLAWRNDSQYELALRKATILVTPNDVPKSQGTYFTTTYREGLTTYGEDWRFYESPGSGWFVGAVQSMQHKHYCEGDEHFTIDGAVSPQINGTGSEDYYLGCFWPNRAYDSPFATCAGNVLSAGGGNFWAAYRMPASYGRFHLEAPIPFFQDIDARIQHGGLNHIRSNYRSLAFCYLQPRPTLRETDFLDVGSPASEDRHDYQAPDSTRTGPVVGHPEGEHLQTTLQERGRRHEGGVITFNIAIDPDNRGVRLRRRLDQSSPRQMARVYVDDVYAGTWYHGYHNEHLRWYDSDLDLHPQHTRGKDSLTIRLEVDAEGGHGAFTDFSYRIYCFGD
jgi:D-arabinan exo alpha-(1,3)/(1,5)-arabinofuranosidase (non-reducing end)